MILGGEVAEAVLRPIEGELAPVGPDGRNSEDEELSDLFRELKAERKSIVKAELLAHTADEEDVPPDFSGRWAALAEEAIGYVSERSKDLEIMTMLVEASVRTEGLAGLGAALNCCGRSLRLSGTRACTRRRTRTTRRRRASTLCRA
jgi:predicted component of type VI protein secretion system